MIRNYLKIALRHLQKNKLYTFINLAGLAIGICGCLLIGLYIWHELSYDRFHENADRIVRVSWEYKFEDVTNQTALTGTRVGPEFTRRFPETEAYVRLLKYPRVLAGDDKMFEEENFLYADFAFFKVFSFPLLVGDPATALEAPEKLVITESMARRTKETAVRKVLGAGVPDILTLVSKDFVKLVGIAIVMAIPLALLAITKWLDGFTYRVNLEWWVFVADSLVTLLITTLTVCLQAIKTARINTVKNLRSE